jgi:hypothetical protein
MLKALHQMQHRSMETLVCLQKKYCDRDVTSWGNCSHHIERKFIIKHNEH